MYVADQGSGLFFPHTSHLVAHTGSLRVCPRIVRRTWARPIRKSRHQVGETELRSVELICRYEERRNDRGGEWLKCWTRNLVAVPWRGRGSSLTWLVMMPASPSQVLLPMFSLLLVESIGDPHSLVFRCTGTKQRKHRK